MRGWSHFAAVFVLFAAGAGVGAALLGNTSQLLVSSVMTATVSYVGAVAENKVLLAAVLFLKNSLVMAVAMFAGEIFSRMARSGWLVMRWTERAAIFFGRLVPVIVLIANAVVLAAVSRALLQSGMQPLLLLASLGPHGFFELIALFLACGSGIAGVSVGQKKLLLAKAVVPLLATAAVVEVWVTPLVISTVV